MEFSIRGLLALLYPQHGLTPPARAQTMGDQLRPGEERINRIATKTAELVAMQIVIILCAVILLGSVTRARVMFGPSEHL